jgi:hypothetical protein
MAGFEVGGVHADRYIVLTTGVWTMIKTLTKPCRRNRREAKENPGSREA